MSRTLLITGATGQQGGAVVKALANNPAFTLLAVTRNASSPSAQKLLTRASNLKLVQGDQDDVPALFKTAKSVAPGSSIWGVFSVQVSQGAAGGSTTESEIRQGKAMVKGSLEAGVKHFVYSSVERGGDEKSWENPTPIPHFASKYELEKFLREKAGSKMGWTVLRPVAFMDNLSPGFGSQVFVAALRDTLGPNKPNQWIAVRDIGIFAQLAFESPDKFNHRALGLAGDELTSSQLSQAFKNQTGSGLDGTFGILGSVLKYMVHELGVMINWFGSDGYKANIPMLKEMHPGLMDMETWIAEESKFTKA